MNNTHEIEFIPADTETTVLKTEDGIIIEDSPKMAASCIREIENLPDHIRKERDIKIEVQDRSLEIDLRTMTIKANPSMAKINLNLIR